MLITDKPTLDRIWSCLHAIHSDARAVQETSSELTYSIVEMFGYLSPPSKLKTITDDLVDFEKEIEALENAADSAAADLTDIHRYTRLIRGALNEMRKEDKEND